MPFRCCLFYRFWFRLGQARVPRRTSLPLGTKALVLLSQYSVVASKLVHSFFQTTLTSLLFSVTTKSGIGALSRGIATRSSHFFAPPLPPIQDSALFSTTLCFDSYSALDVYCNWLDVLQLQASEIFSEAPLTSPTSKRLTRLGFSPTLSTTLSFVLGCLFGTWCTTTSVTRCCHFDGPLGCSWRNFIPVTRLIDRHSVRESC